MGEMFDKVRAKPGDSDEMGVMWECPECGIKHGAEAVDIRRIETRTQCFHCYHPFKVTFDADLTN